MIFEKEIGGVKFKACYKGIETSNRIQDESLIEGTNIMSTLKLAQHLFDEIIIEPKKLSFDYFDSFENSLEIIDEVIGFGVNAMLGRNGRELTDRELKTKINNEWGAWRLILSDMGNFTHDYVFHHMTPQEIREANLAIDRAIKEIRKR